MFVLLDSLLIEVSHTISNWLVTQKKSLGLIFKVLYDRIYSLFQIVGSEKIIIKKIFKFVKLLVPSRRKRVTSNMKHASVTLKKYNLYFKNFESLCELNKHKRVI